MSEIITAENLTEIGIRHGFFTSSFGDCGYAKGAAAGNENTPEGRRQVAEALDVTSENLVSCFQIHSPDVAVVTKAWSVADRPKADAMVTKIPGIALGILTADCVPLLLADKASGVIGAAHAGWRGAISGVIENTLDAMEKLGASRKTIHAAIGPCIGPRSYEVSVEFPAPFLAEDPDNEKFFRPAERGGHMMFDLPGYVAAKLRRLGLISIEPSPADTCAEEARFFSHRRSTLRKVERGGSLISVIMLGD